jgi:deoxyguanosine kinase
MTRLRSGRPRLEICGGIASGKTTLAKLLKRAGFTPVLEEFQRNPFLSAFYSNQVRYAVETELSFLLQHFHAIKKSASSPAVRACDFSFVLDHAYAKVTLPVRQQRQFGTVLRWLIEDVAEAPLLVHLICPPAIELRRIRRRGRVSERGVSEAYLADVNNQLADLVSRAKAKVFVLDSNAVNFSTDGRMQKRVVTDLKNFVRRWAR